MQETTGTSLNEGSTNLYQIRKRMIVAMAVLLIPLVLATTASVFFHRTAAVNARYTVALSQLVEGMAQIDGHVARIEAGREDAVAAAVDTYVKTLGLYSALRAADPDGDEIMDDSEAPKRGTLSERTQTAGIDPVALGDQLGLIGFEMPDELADIWEEEEDWTSGQTNSPTLEASFAKTLLMAANIFVDGKRNAASIEQFWSASAHPSDAKLSEISAVLQRNSIQAGQTPILLALLVLGIVLAAAALAWAFVVRPLINQVVHVQGALKQEATAARAADLAKTQFLATISHELRTPMNGIIGAAQLLHHSELSEEDREVVDILNSCADGQLTLIDEILTFGEVEVGALSMVKEPVDVAHLIRNSTDFATILAEKKGLTLDVIVPEDMPEIIGDTKRLRQIIVNLVGNAIKFTETGGVTVQVALEQSKGPEDMTFRVVVTDTGLGIAPEHREHIFERFTQGDSSSSRKAGGTGLGLAIAQGIAREAGGDITVESELGHGSAFTLSVPTGDAAAMQNETHQERLAA